MTTRRMLDMHFAITSRPLKWMGPAYCGTPSKRIFNFYWPRWLLVADLIELCDDAPAPPLRKHFIFVCILPQHLRLPHIYTFFAVGLVAPAQLHNKWKTESELATFIFFSTAADSLKTLNCVRVKIVWLNLPWQRIGCRGPQRPQWSLICGYNNTTADKHTAFCATYFSRHSRVKVEKLYVSSSFAFECGSWFTQNDLITIQTQVVRVKKIKATKTRMNACEIVKML